MISLRTIASSENTNGHVPEDSIIPRSVSIIIAAYNCADTIGSAVESCLAQCYDRLEVIVVNDGSTDGTADVLKTFGSRITVVTQPNGGLANARNAGVRAASGDYVAWMDADDLADPERIRLQANVLDSNSAIELVSSDFSSFVTVDADTEYSHIGTYYSALDQLGGLAQIYSHSRTMDLRKSGKPVTMRWGNVYEHLIVGNFVHPPTVMVRRSVFDQVGYFDETLRYNSDYDLIVRVARVGAFGVVDVPLLRYRRSTNQMSHSAAGGKIALETVRILEKVQREDPDFHARQQSLIRLRISESLIEAADSIGSGDRGKALRLWMRGVRGLPIFGGTLHAIARILTPRIVVVTAKGMRRMIHWTFALMLIYELAGRAETIISLLPESAF